MLALNSTTHAKPIYVQSAQKSRLPARDNASVGLAELARILDPEASVPESLRDISFPVRRVRAGDFLLRSGAEFDAVYAVRCGFFKTLRVDEAGTEQVLAFPITGEMIGLDGIGTGKYMTDVVALDASTVIVIPFARLANLARDNAWLERLLYRLFGRELTCTQSLACALGLLPADARVATFLLDLSERFAQRGYSSSAFVLRMTRADIGSYLGIKLETVSRTLSGLVAAGLIEVYGKNIVLRDIPALRQCTSMPALKRGGDARFERRMAA
jgi:CRP/FNR family transcriptional regulator